MRVQLPMEGSAAAIAQRILGPRIGVSQCLCEKLSADQPMDCDVLVFGDDKEARQLAIDLVVACGLRGLHGGPLVNSAAADSGRRNPDYWPMS